MSNDRNLKTQDKIIKAFISVATATLLSAVICAILLIILSLIFTNGQIIPYLVISQMVMLISAISVFIGGIIVSKVSKTKGLALGATTGLIMFMIIAICSILIFDEPFTSTALLRAALLVISGALGGVIGINKKKRRKR